MIYRYNIITNLKSTTKEIFDIKLLLMIIYINSKLLYKYLIKLGHTYQKWLIIDLIYLW